jgi:hypothetical protein
MAAQTILRYMLKHDSPWPEWLMQLRYVRPFITSKGFWPPRPSRRPKSAPRPTPSRPPRAPARTIGQQIAACGRTQVITRLTSRIDPITALPVKHHQFVAQIQLDPWEIAALQYRLGGDGIATVAASSVQQALDILSHVLGRQIQPSRLPGTQTRTTGPAAASSSALPADADPPPGSP